MQSIMQEHSPVNNGNLTVLNTAIRTLDGLYSLNDLHKVSGKSNKHQPARFVRLDQTKELITEIERSPDLAIANERSTDMQIAIKTKRGGTNQGTYACKELVYAYAMWISPKFNLLVIRSFDERQKQPSNVHQLPFLNERVMFSWENGALVNSRPVAANEIITTKERVLKLVLAHDFTTVDERVALIEALNADLAQYTKDVMHALKNTRKKRQSMTRIN